MVYMLLGTGFEETEAIAPLDLLRRAGVEIQTVGLNGKIVYGSHKIGVEAATTPTTTMQTPTTMAERTSNAKRTSPSRLLFRRKLVMRK